MSTLLSEALFALALGHTGGEDYRDTRTHHGSLEASTEIGD